MATNEIVEILREGVWVVIRMAAPMLLLSMMVGIFVAIFQAVTQIHEQTLNFILKLSVVLLVLLVAGNWMGEGLLDYANRIFALMATV